ncbi:hypothetical protein [Novosphingobium lindaniclasticum]|uniref:Uncharacterized protein n=1 Tax=Novosphingobium lindaniclasticum LE124 TaxID=1096930 RepID=T0IL82_9SPHN|nr:hypothetical protein [Novosphingobium lindaniclasticum]EQB10394.1 hypothetical protein L284_17010 [Novosphingobium lindaniclasticum LE124]
MDELLYENMVEAAAERAAETGAVDLVDITNAAASGFDTNHFVNDVNAMVSKTLDDA